MKQLVGQLPDLPGGISRHKPAAFLASAALALASVAPAFPQSSSLPPEWEVRESLNALAQQVGRFEPILKELKVQDWIAQGAPDAYRAQHKSVAAEIDFLATTSQNLARQPDRLTLAVETLLRLQALEAMLESLNEGIRRYQNPALADLLRGVMTDTAVQRDKLRQYVVALASAKEEELKVMHEEAQRCREIISRQPPPAKPKAGKRTQPK